MAPVEARTQGGLNRELSDHDQELQLARAVSISIDLVEAAKRQLGFLRTIDSITSLHCYGPTVLQAIRRYQNCWMPLAAEAEDLDQEVRECALLPPIDVQWVWHCHCLSPMAYREFCKSRYGRVINCPLLPDPASEAAARERCRKRWTERYGDEEPFDVSLVSWEASASPDVEEEDTTAAVSAVSPEIADIVAVISRQSSFYYQVSQPYMWEEAFLQTALERYKCFLYLVNKSRGTIMCVPTYDIDLIWHAHQVLPVAYARDTKALLGCVVDHDDSMERGPSTKLGNSFDDTARLWESTFGDPYERAGSMYRGSPPVNLPAPPHDGSDGQKILEWKPVGLSPHYGLRDINRQFPILVPRRVVQVCILIRSATTVTPVTVVHDNLLLFVRLRALRAHHLLKLDTPMAPFPSYPPQWQKLWHLHCELATGGVALELRCRRRQVEDEDGGGVCRLMSPLLLRPKSKLLGSTVLTWEKLHSSSTLSVDTVVTRREKGERKQPVQVRVGASMTPPVQGPYLLKSVPDRVTDDEGAMLSNLILKMNKYQPQRGRWLSRTVLNHMGKECFVIRIRAVYAIDLDTNCQIIESGSKFCDGLPHDVNRVAKGIWRKNGDRPEGVEWNERVINVCEGGWSYIAGPTGYAPSKIVGSAMPCADELEHYRLSWHLTTGATLVISRSLEEGDDWEHRLQFSLTGSTNNLVRLINGRKLQYEVPNAQPLEEEGFVTLIRYNATTPQGKATALFNWKVSAMEIHPEEDVVLVLLLCTAIMRSVADFGGKHSGNLFAQRRKKESKPGQKDWGSVVVEQAAAQSNLAMWYLNTTEETVEETPTRGGGGSVRGGHAGPMGGHCGSSCGGDVGLGAVTTVDAGWRQVTKEKTSVATVGAWGRRTGSGIQLDLTRLPKKK